MFVFFNYEPILKKLGVSLLLKDRVFGLPTTVSIVVDVQESNLKCRTDRPNGAPT